jgi:PPM family protein phosphatase
MTSARQGRSANGIERGVRPVTLGAPPTMESKLFLFFDGLTDVGLRRQNNEDAWWIGAVGGGHCYMEPGPAPLQVLLGPGGAPALLLVSDGVGGARAGEVASQLAVGTISRELLRNPMALTDAPTARQAIFAALRAANEAISSKAKAPEFEGMGATLSLLCFAGAGEVCWGQLGDSRIYVCREGQLRQISRDHSPVGRLRQEGKISEAEARRHPIRNQIDQSLGAPDKLFRPDLEIETIQPGDVYLLCSDGLSDGLWDREIAAILTKVCKADDVRPAVQRLVSRAKQASGRDNITAVVALVSDSAATKQRKTSLMEFFSGGKSSLKSLFNNE